MRVSHLAVLFGVALVTSGLRAEDSLLRDLSVEQTTAFQAGTPAPGSLRVSAWVDRHDLTYAHGDAVRIFVKTNEDAYVTIVNVGPSGKVTHLFPNAFQQSNRVAANRTLEVPSGNGGSRINVSGPVAASSKSTIWLRLLSRSSGSAIASGVSPTRLRRGVWYAGAFEALSFRSEHGRDRAVNRRDLISLVGSAVAWPLAAQAQQPWRTSSKARPFLKYANQFFI